MILLLKVFYLNCFGSISSIKYLIYFRIDPIEYNLAIVINPQNTPETFRYYSHIFLGVYRFKSIRFISMVN